MKKQYISKVIIAAFATSFWSCSADFLEPTVSTSKDVSSSVNTLEDLQGLVLGAYDRMNEPTYYGRDYIVFAEVRSDNALANGNSGRFVGPGQFFLNTTDAYPRDTWQQLYRVIANTNIVVNAEVEENESAEVKYAKGQAYAVRGLAYMDLLRLYGQQWTGGNLGVPIVTEFNSGDLAPARNTVEEVWAQVGSDLQMAKTMMDPTLDAGSPVEISSTAVDALLSRYYLYVKNWPEAAAAAKRVIDSGVYSLESASSFSGSWGLSGGDNIIFELAYTPSDNPSINGLYNIYQETNYGDIEITKNLYDVYDTSDVRLDLLGIYEDTTQKVTRYRMVGKYITPATYNDNVKVIRYAEVILNYAEALFQQGSTSEALTYLNMIPENRGATVYTEVTVDNILLERRKELAMEGFRFFDLMRYERPIPKVDNRQTFDATIPYGDERLAFPIPQAEVNANPSIVQNTGY
ncbi:Starch-binding associating with outer membrane [Catalinimonas alkaloidigena]|uniref:Starch-binding associating with outer membrane n=1 Tax=Catalinimonas alkaloidigena TaxID=1075417 RepID=A0A1G9GWN4_9BACT|nr:RagB/SusD family nutrient uptake outer membrane protein [Catalinimonas alkaloidigena]SDL05099.1 Starch-binding associating with outer membrane [Catalinimonas alkaloidigena]